MIIKCPHCGKEVSNRLSTCFYCKRILPVGIVSLKDAKDIRRSDELRVEKRKTWKFFKWYLIICIPIAIIMILISVILININQKKLIEEEERLSNISAQVKEQYNAGNLEEAKNLVGEIHLSNEFPNDKVKHWDEVRSNLESKINNQIAQKQEEERIQGLMVTLSGTYAGEQGSVLVLYQDGIAEYYYKDWEDTTKNFWSISGDSLSINLDVKVAQITVRSVFNPDNPTILLFTSSDDGWQKEEYTRVSNYTIKFNKSEYDDFISSAYGN